MDGSQRITAKDVLRVFNQIDDPCESLSTSEVADALDCAHRTAYSKLNALVDSGSLKTKKVGAQVRIWWRPQNGSTVATHSETIDQLTAEQVLELELRSEQIARPFVEAGGSDFTVSTDGTVLLEDGMQIQYYTATGIPTSTYLELTKQYPAVHDVRLISSVENTTRLEVLSGRDSLTRVFSDYSGQFKSAEIEGSTAILLGEVPQTVDLDELLTDLRELYPDIELVSQRLVYTPQIFRKIMENTLTERQWTTLQLAHFAGYFEWPRVSTGEDLGGQLGITKQTFYHHLRHAEQAVFQYLFEGVTSHRL
ncbi:bacterio-opsin activator domain-containing protein [Haladaptatus sp. DFWS20]|uniref:bacterio-opsin activator domain-containing protein n=1 Tax=Haladaptatus sp. DFWS20 TaxID=3403467 RepID=UPI003EB6B689